MEDLEKLAAYIRKINSWGHSPSTAGNYSMRDSSNPNRVFLSESGIDKSEFQSSNFLTMDLQGNQDDKSRRSSAETHLHLLIYQETTANCVLHAHSVESLLVAENNPTAGHALFEGLEMLKAIKGHDTHETKVILPIYDNSQDIEALAELIRPMFSRADACAGFLIRGHGIYTWGDDLAMAKRHYEGFQYLFEYAMKRKVLFGL